MQIQRSLPQRHAFIRTGPPNQPTRHYLPFSRTEISHQCRQGKHVHASFRKTLRPEISQVHAENTSARFYEYTRFVFWAECSPTCANFALQTCGDDNKNGYPPSKQQLLSTATSTWTTSTSQPTSWNMCLKPHSVILGPRSLAQIAL